MSKAMETVTHYFVWESDASHAVFWRNQPHVAERARTETAQLIGRYHLQPPATVLGVGCGLGLHLAEFGWRGFVATGIEVADTAITHVRRNRAALTGCRVLNKAAQKLET